MGCSGPGRLFDRLRTGMAIPVSDILRDGSIEEKYILFDDSQQLPKAIEIDGFKSLLIDRDRTGTRYEKPSDQIA